MAEFNDLPIELLPFIIQYLVNLKPQHLAWPGQVSKAFYRCAVPKLYAFPMLHAVAGFDRSSNVAWNKVELDSLSFFAERYAFSNERIKLQVKQLLWTLANCPRLARFVVRLDIRYFPEVLGAAERDAVFSMCFKAIRNCRLLRSFAWTRDFSLSTRILYDLNRYCPNLDELEFNGRPNGNYDPKALVNFIGLRSISVFAPGPEVMGMFPMWMVRTGDSLRSLTLNSTSSNHLVTDVLLESIAVSLMRLEQIRIVGCRRVTHRGIYALFSKNIVGIRSLGLEGLSELFEMSEFVNNCQHTVALTHLHSFTITSPVTGVTSDWLTSLSQLLQSSPLQTFYLYTPGGVSSAAERLDDYPFVEELCKSHGGTLIQFGVLSLRVRLDTLDILVEKCGNLEQLFVWMEQDDLIFFPSTVSRAKFLQSIHLNFVLWPGYHSDITLEGLHAIVKDCPSTVTQFGARNHETSLNNVYRIPVPRRDGSGFDMRVKLGPLENADTPEWLRGTVRVS
ncbi:hypothetical protein BD410DRAFT_835109 [Rickenella mellea]|uniref:F-box domain-containing protein n=1 Tax=Rickenella mellea TaxID=50990 RepID=A0A4Y7QKD0_9AGAM|nr:hypothetical protein BD410DRAFT_835109 [Rickenella mellea]